MKDRILPDHQGNEAFKSSFGDTLRRLRESQDLSQRHLAAYSDMDHSTISRYEHGKDRDPLLSNAVKLAFGMRLTPWQRLALYESALTFEEISALRGGTASAEVKRTTSDTVLPTTVFEITE